MCPMIIANTVVIMGGITVGCVESAPSSEERADPTHLTLITNEDSHVDISKQGS